MISGNEATIIRTRVPVDRRCYPGSRKKNTVIGSILPIDRLEWMMVKEPAGQYIYIYPTVDAWRCRGGGRPAVCHQRQHSSFVVVVRCRFEIHTICPEERVSG
jgi:hypothetical protein